jgi:hypothetical protein
MKDSISAQVRKELNKELQRDIGKKLEKGFDAGVAHTPVDTGQLRASWTMGTSESYYTKKKKPRNHPHGRDIFGGRKNRNRSRMHRFVTNIDWFSPVPTIIMNNSMDYSSFVDGKNSITHKIISTLR